MLVMTLSSPAHDGIAESVLVVARQGAAADRQGAVVDRMGVAANRQGAVIDRRLSGRHRSCSAEAEKALDVWIFRPATLCASTVMVYDNDFE
jgi:hypothetical protein